MVGKYEELSRQIVKELGGKGNIRGISHCITRLRFKLKDEKKVRESAVRLLPGVITVLRNAGQFQIVIGNHVQDVFEEVCQLTGFQPDGEGAAEMTGSLLDRLVEVITGSFQPFVGPLCAVGMIKGINALFLFLGFYTELSGTYLMLNAIGDAIFKFFPVMLGLTSANKFGMNRFVGIVIGAALCYGVEVTGPVMTFFGLEYSLTFLGIPWIVQDYTGSVIPVIVIVWFASHIERVAKKYVPEVLRTFFVPFFTLIISLPVGFLVIGPVVSALSILIGDFFIQINDFSPLLFGLGLGALWQVLVIFGLHWSLIPLALMNLNNFGVDPIMAPMYGCTFAQTACVLAIYLRSKDKAVRELCIPAIISGVCGVTEPAIYGITLPKKKPFWFSLVGGAAGGVVMTMLSTKSYLMGGLGVFGIINFIDPVTNDISGMFHALLCIIVSSLVGFLLTFFLWREDAQAEKQAPRLFNPQAGMASVLSPAAGLVIPLEQVADEAFSQGVLGKGVAIIPNEGRIVAPFTGVVETLSDTLHALCLTSLDGVELLIHVGLNTVALGGEYFTAHVTPGEQVSVGQLLLTVDLDKVRQAGFSLQTPVVVINSDAYAEVLETPREQVNYSDRLLTAIK